ncbi:multifunctional protein ADE2 [Mugil cephalus]|nr:multifunctional protein ADE2 [Mugil cephalus]
MERGAERQRGGEMEVVEEKGSVEMQWGEAEVLALISVWNELGAQHVAESRNKFELISERLRRLSVIRGWKQCQAKSRSLGLQSKKPDAAAGTSANYSPGMDGKSLEGWKEEVDGVGSQRGIFASSVTIPMQEGAKIQTHPTVAYTPNVAEEGGRHWTDDEVRALLCVWADRRIQERLKCTLRNKSIFQEMSRQMQRNYGVVRNWKQCRTKYKNLKYDYKTAKSAHAAGGSGAGGPGKYMKFFDEVEAILLDRGLENGTVEMQRRLYTEEMAACMLKAPGAHTGQGPPSEGEVVIEIDDGMYSVHNASRGFGLKARKSFFFSIFSDDNSDDYDIDGDVETKWKGADARLLHADSSSSDQLNVVTVSDTGRNWSDQEVQALIQVWSDERICRQLESSTRKRDIFVQISKRLLQQGIERDWKQCHTKYKNLKYLYRSLQRGKTDEVDPRRLMRFYDEVDSIMSQIKSSSPRDIGGADSADSSRLTVLEGFEENKHLSSFLTKATVGTAATGDVEERTISCDSSVARDVSNTGDLRQRCLDRHHRLSSASETRPEIVDTCSAGRGMKRKAVDPDPTLQTPVKRLDIGPDFACKGAGQVKEEPGHFPIINSVCSMATPNLSPERQVIPANAVKTEETLLPQVVGMQMCSTQPKTPHSSPIPFSSNSIPPTSSAPGPPEDCSRPISAMASTPELNIGKKLNEGKTKQIFELVDQPGLVLVQSKDQITAGNAVRKDQMEGKAAIANKTTSSVFQLLQESGIKTAFVKQHSDTAFIAAHCEMIPIEWVCRRVATGSFLKRNPGVKEGYRFSPLKMEMFFKDDANNDPQWSEEQLLEAKFSLAGLTIGQCEVDIMNRSTVAIFEILEKAWATQNCTLVDMKIEFGVNVKTQEIVLADVIDNDSWRLWPAGDRSQQKDKQVYRDLKEVTPEAMQMVKRNFEWVSERVKLLLESQASGRVVVLMGSTSDMAHCEKIRKACTSYGISCILRVTSAHKGPDETLRIKAEYEGDGVPTVFVAVAGRSNGLGPVMSGNTAYPVINCPPLTPDWGAQDVWSSLRMPSGLGCSTILSPEAAAQFAAQIFGLTDHLVWCKLRASMLNTWVSLKLADKKLQACSL